MEYVIREIKPDEIPLLEDFLYEAIYLADGTQILPKDIIHQPDLWMYIDGFGKKDDHCLVAEVDGRVVGAVWARIFDGERKGYGTVDSHTPEISISLYQEFRGYGIGTALMKAMLLRLKTGGYSQVSLSVHKGNPAATIYRLVGFEVYSEADEEQIMVCKLNG